MQRAAYWSGMSLSPQGENDQHDDDDDYDGSNSDINGSALLLSRRRRPSCPVWRALNIRGGPRRPRGGRSGSRRAQACLRLALPQQPALLLGQAAPDSLQGPGGQRVTKAVAAHPAGGADRLGACCLPEGGTRSGDREEQVGV